MEKQVANKFTWVIKNFDSSQAAFIYSDQFMAAGCKWCLLAYPKGYYKIANHLSLYLHAVDFESLPCGWRKHVEFSFTIVNQSLEKLSQHKKTQRWFDEKEPDWGFLSMLPLNEIHSKDSGFLVNGGLMIVAEVNDVELIGKLDEPMDVNGFHVLPSQVKSVNRLFKRHPEIAKKVRIKNQYLKTGYMNVLLSLTETVHRSPKDISKADLADAYAALESMTDYGFELDWLEKKLDLVSVKKEKEEDGETRMQAIEEELKGFKRKCSDLEAISWTRQRQRFWLPELLSCYLMTMLPDDF